MKFSALLMTACVFAVIPSYGQVTTALKLDVGTGSVTIDQSGNQTYSGACSVSTCPGTPTVAAGSIVWSGRIGDFTVSQVTGRTKPGFAPPAIDLASVLQTGPVGGTLTVSFSDTNFTNGGNPAALNIVGAGNIGTSSFSGYADNGNNLFGTTGPTAVLIATSSHGGFISGPGATSMPFSLTLQEQITLPANVGSDFPPYNNDFKVEASPNAPLGLACAATSGTTGTQYSSQLEASGGALPYTYSILQGSISPLVLNPSTGAITGTVTTDTTLNFTAQVVDSSGTDFNTTISSCSIQFSTPTPQMTLACPASTPTLQQFVAYNGGFVETGGTSPFTYSIPTGSLPTGLFLNAGTGAITGTPTAQGTATFTGKVVDSSSPNQTATTTASCSLTVGPPPPITSNCVTINATQGQAIIPVTLTATGGDGGPYTFTASGLPTGLSISAAGVISGTPTVGGTFPYTVTITDGHQDTGTLNCSLSVTPVGSIGILVWNDLNNSGTYPPDAGEPGLSGWTVTLSGTSGGTLSTDANGGYKFTGLLAGSYTVCVTPQPGYIETYPVKAGTNCFTGTLTAGQNRVDFNFGYVLTSQQLPLSLTCPSSIAQTGVAYSSALIAANGVSPYTYSITVGSLPAGLTLNATTGAITGTPTTAQSVTFTAKVIDSSAAHANTTASCNIGVSGVIAHGDAATIGFWHNKNGQALIKAATPATGGLTLANWLATSFPYLYGAHAPSGSNLTNASNATVAALFMTYFNGGAPKTSAQIMAGALASWFTNSTLSKNTGVQFGFNYSAGGTGGKLYNIGSDGTALGLPNNSLQGVLTLLQLVNTSVQNGTYAAKAGAFNDVFNGINTTGDIQ